LFLFDQSSDVLKLFESKDVKTEICQGKTYHPWVNGQAERTIRTFKKMMKTRLSTVNVNELTLEEFSIILKYTTSVYNNTSKNFHYLWFTKTGHSTTDMAPNEVITGEKSRIFLFKTSDELEIPAEVETEEVALNTLQNKILSNHVNNTLSQLIMFLENSSREFSKEDNQTRTQKKFK
jgi:hypothetical protein